MNLHGGVRFMVRDRLWPTMTGGTQHGLLLAG